MMRRFLAIALMFTFLVGCKQADISGVVIDVSDQYLLIAQNITIEEYETIKHRSPTDIQNDDVAGIGPHFGLIEIVYDQVNQFSKGDYVDVWLKGDIRESYPSSADAKKVRLIK